MATIPILAPGAPPGVAPLPVDEATGLSMEYPPPWYFEHGGAVPQEPAAAPDVAPAPPAPEQARLQPHPFVDELAGAPEPPMPWPHEELTPPTSSASPAVPPAPPESVDMVSGAGRPQATAPGRTYASPAEPGKNSPRASTGDPNLDAVLHAQDQKTTGIRAEAEAEKAKNAYLVEENRKANEAAAAQQAAIESARLEAKAEAKTKTEALNKEAEALANEKIDGKRAFKDQDMSRILLMAGAALSGWGNPRGKNPALEVIAEIVDRDMAEQRENLEGRRSGLMARRGLLADEIAAGRDDIDARYKAMQTGLQISKNATIEYAQRFDNPVIDARAQQTVADAEQASAQLALQYQQQAEQKAYSRRMDQAQLGIQYGNLDLARRQQSFDEMASMQPKAPTVRDQVMVSREQRESQKYHDERLIPEARTKKGGEVLALQEGDAKDVRSKMALVTGMNQKFDRLEQIYEKHGWAPFGQWTAWDPAAQEDMKEAQLIMGTILPEFSKANDQGVIRDSEYPMYFKMFGDPKGLLDPRTNFRKMREMSVQGMNNELRTRVGEDVAWWTPQGVKGGNDETRVTPEDAAREKRARAEDKRANDAAPPPEWEIVGQSPDGAKSITASGLVIPAGRQIVNQYKRRGPGGRRHVVTELDDGTTFDYEDED